MERTRWTGKRRALVVAAFALACVTLLRMAGPVSVSSPELGGNWRCSTTAFVLTPCTPVRWAEAEPAKSNQR
jgi:hypothetical protein